MAKVPFDSIFNVATDGSVEPKQTIRIGGVTLGPGIKMIPGVSIAGIDIAAYKDHELEITTDDGTIVITGIY